MIHNVKYCDLEAVRILCVAFNSPKHILIHESRLNAWISISKIVFIKHRTIKFFNENYEESTVINKSTFPICKIGCHGEFHIINLNCNKIFFATWTCRMSPNEDVIHLRELRVKFASIGTNNFRDIDITMQSKNCTSNLTFSVICRSYRGINVFKQTFISN